MYLELFGNLHVGIHGRFFKSICNRWCTRTVLLASASSSNVASYTSVFSQIASNEKLHCDWEPFEQGCVGVDCLSLTDHAAHDGAHGVETERHPIHFQ